MTTDTDIYLHTNKKIMNVILIRNSTDSHTDENETTRTLRRRRRSSPLASRKDMAFRAHNPHTCVMRIEFK